MAKEFYTERDIEDMVKRGVTSLQVGDDVVLTELAYEKAQRLGMQLVRERPLEPPAAPVRPYLSEACKPGPTSPAPATAAAAPDLPARIREAVTSRLGAQVDPALLESIIQRVLKSTGLK
jgi:hypothetical protein